jgi:hypothetical protein
MKVLITLALITVFNLVVVPLLAAQVDTNHEPRLFTRKGQKAGSNHVERFLKKDLKKEKKDKKKDPKKSKAPTVAPVKPPVLSPSQTVCPATPAYAPPANCAAPACYSDMGALADAVNAELVTVGSTFTATVCRNLYLASRQSRHHIRQGKTRSVLLWQCQFLYH